MSNIKAKAMKLKYIIITAIILYAFTYNKPKQCIATWYLRHGATTASGTKMHRDSMTAAYNDVAFGTRLQVTNMQTGDTVVVTVNDRMENKTAGRIDLSRAAFTQIADPRQGRIRVAVKRIAN